MVARGLQKTPDLFEGRINIAWLWLILRDVAIQIENEMMLGNATIITLPEGEERAKTLSNMRKMLYPDEISPFEALIKKYTKLLPHATGEKMTIQKVSEDSHEAQQSREMLKAPIMPTRGK